MQPLKVGGAIHTCLLYLKENKEATGHKLCEIAQQKVVSLRAPGFMHRLLPNAIADGLLQEDGTKITATAKGLDELEKLTVRKALKPVKPTNLVPANLYRHNTDKGNYTGEELMHRSVRTDAFDYLSCPSVINGKVVPYHFQKRG